ncbi:clavesin-2 isoform X2 [Gallus gallus]|uniref:clavesin-2 isoform X2 n=1 Tax=Gallus gallus TaxID=9031 RepID=UPI001AE44D37|nr:clavesin-2 isoform X2 [Gallus gallus]
MTHLQAGLSPETLEKARLELNENPDTLHQDIQEVRDMVITRPDIGFLRTDDAFILRFLRARKFQHFEAFRLLAQYFEYRQQNLDMFKSFKATDPGIKQALKDGFPGGLANLDHYGRKILVLFAANWDQSRYTLVDILRAILLSLEAMIEDPELQVNGFVLIIDWSNFTFKQASKLTPSMLRLAIEGLQDSFPARFGGIHFVNQPWYIHALYTVIRPFLKEKTRKRGQVSKELCFFSANTVYKATMILGVYLFITDRLCFGGLWYSQILNYRLQKLLCNICYKYANENSFCRIQLHSTDYSFNKEHYRARYV